MIRVKNEHDYDLTIKKHNKEYVDIHIFDAHSDNGPSVWALINRKEAKKIRDYLDAFIKAKS